MVSTLFNPMTYTEYCNQTEPMRMPNVVLGRGDCTVRYWGMGSDRKKHYEVSIDFNGKRMDYSLIPLDGNCLKVISDGKVNGRLSCFHLDVDQFPEVFDEENQILR